MTVELCVYSALTARLVNRDLHTHTSRTDGRSTLDEMLAAARARGLTQVAVTDHVRRDSSWFHEHARSVRSARVDGLDVRVGLEAKALDTAGTLDATEAMLAEAELVLGSVHRFPDGSGGFVDYASLSPSRMIETELALALGLIRSGSIHVLAHPGGMCQRQIGAFPDDAYRELMREGKKRGVAIEMNASYLGDMARFLRLCEEIDPIVSVASDAHGVEELGRCRDLLLGLGVS